jgi:hypothetical protein
MRYLHIRHPYILDAMCIAISVIWRVRISATIEIFITRLQWGLGSRTKFQKKKLIG